MGAKRSFAEQSRNDLAAQLGSLGCTGYSIGVVFQLTNACSSCVILSVPHAGRAYPDHVVAALAVPLAQARAVEDRHADRLVDAALADGMAAIVAHVPRLMIDLNRAETDLETRPLGMPISARARAGLGLVPTRVAGIGLLWGATPRATEIAERIATVHRPYHAALTTLLATARARHGVAVLIDVHSMPPLPGLRRPEIVIGTRGGASASPALVMQAACWWRTHGYRVAIDVPYAGAHILDRHGRPHEGIDALQLEIDRRLYLDPELVEPGAGLERMQKRIAAFARAAHGWAVSPSLAIAAE